MAFGLLACSAGTESGDGWREVGGLDGDFIQFVEIDAAHAHDVAAYKAAADTLCGSEQCYQLGFFIAGDPIPPSGSRRDFFQTGGWGSYSPAAVYAGESHEFTKWDCQRAGAIGAPLSALCGTGAREQFGAVLALATRTGWTVSCHLPATTDRALVERFIAKQGPSERRTQLQAEFESMYASASEGPDDPAACGYLRRGIENKARDARVVLNAALAGAQFKQ